MNQTTETKIELALDQLSRVRQDIKDSDVKTENRFQRLEEKIDNQYVLKSEHSGLAFRVGELEANNRWLVRTFIGAVIAAVVSFFFAFKQ